ncbi:ATP-binding protein [Haliea sp. E17]|uniref:ATP-binding protein n=1 Tax=Haliea sp. E17 TaxID=3401576 RepID=UPI003AAFB0A8
MNFLFHSIAGRLVLGSALLLAVFLSASGWYLEGSHRKSLEAAEVERLQLQLFTLLAQAEFEASFSMPAELIERRYNQPGSGLYARVTDASGRILWLSPSAVTLPASATTAAPTPLQPGEHHFSRRGELYSLAWQVVWAAEEGEEIPLQFTVMETAAPLEADIAEYGRGLRLWLGGSALLLLLFQALVLGWALRPLHRLAGEVGAIEAGEAELLGEDYPQEVLPLTSNLNTLLAGERQRRERVRNTLADLAHSLKTPLAVLRGADPQHADYAALVGEQTAHMEQIVSYQLQRASGGSHRLLQLLPVAPLVQRLRDTLLKVYADRNLHIELAIVDSCRFRGDERDLMEVLGNLMDNACKYGRRQVRVSAEGSAPKLLRIRIEDDGPGIPPGARQHSLLRGTRLDQMAPGQGLGLAVAADIVESYRGWLEISDSPLGGARVTLTFP